MRIILFLILTSLVKICCGQNTHSGEITFSNFYPDRKNLSYKEKYDCRCLSKVYKDTNELIAFLKTVPDTFTGVTIIDSITEHLPDIFFKHKRLVSVYVYAKKLNAVDERFAKLDSLGELYIYTDYLSHIPIELSKLTALTILDITVKRKSTKIGREAARLIKRSKSAYLSIVVNGKMRDTQSKGKIIK